MHTPVFRSDLLIGTVSGTVLVLACSTPLTDTLQTIYLAIMGAVISYLVTHLMKWLKTRWQRFWRRHKA